MKRIYQLSLTGPEMSTLALAMKITTTAAVYGSPCDRSDLLRFKEMMGESLSIGKKVATLGGIDVDALIAELENEINEEEDE